MTALPTAGPQQTDRFGRADAAITRLNGLSAGRGHEAYRDIPWDEPGNELGPDDPRLILPSSEPLTRTAWYAGLSDAERARVGAWKLACSLRVGADFENLLQQALLSRALTLPLGVPEFRYLHHEVSEESEHTMMFHEIAHRVGVPAPGMPWLLRKLVEVTVPSLARHDPPGFFLTVLAGEDPVDRMQRRWLAEGVAHPVVEQVLQIHVAEESRHVSYAKMSVQRDAPRLGPVRRQILGVTAPLTFGLAARLMFVPPPAMARALGVPWKTLRAAYESEEGRAFLADSCAKPRRLVAEVGLITRAGAAMWRWLGIGGPETARAPRRQRRRTGRATA